MKVDLWKSKVGGQCAARVGQAVDGRRIKPVDIFFRAVFLTLTISITQRCARNAKQGLGIRPNNLCLIKFCRWYWDTLKAEAWI